jgi:hypothetical protein
MKLVSRGMLLATLLAIVGCCTTNQIITTKDGSKVPVPSKCDALVQYQAAHFTFAGIDVPIPQMGGTVKIGQVEWKKDKLQEAAAAAQILDQRTVENCKLLATRGSLCTDKELLAYLDKYEDTRDKLMQLGILMNSNQPDSPKMVAKLIDKYFDFMYQKSLGGERFLVLKEDVKKVPIEQFYLK